MKVILIILMSISSVLASEKLKRYDMRTIISLDKNGDEEFRAVLNLVKRPSAEAHNYFHVQPNKLKAAKMEEARKLRHEKALAESKRRGLSAPDPYDPGITDGVTPEPADQNPPQLYFVKYKGREYNIIAPFELKIGDGKRTQCSLIWCKGVDGEPILLLKSIKKK